MAEDTVNTDNVQEPAKDDNMIMCPCCGQNTLHKPITPKQDVVDQWLACIVTGTPFSHTYSMYKDRIKVTVTVADDKLRRTMTELRTWLTRAMDRLWPELERRPFNVDEMLVRCQVLGCITAIDVKDKDKVLTALPSAIVSSVYNSIKPFVDTAIFGDQNQAEFKTVLLDCHTRLYDTKNVSAVPMDLLASAVYTHATLNRYMLDMGTASDFWTGIELA